MPVPKLAMNKQERVLVAQLRHCLPKTAPDGWRTKGMQRFAPAEQVSAFGVIYEGKGMRFVCTAYNETFEYSLSGTECQPSAEMIAEAKKDFFPDKEIQHTSPLEALVFLQVVG